MPEIITRPYIPEEITVHLGRPEEPAQNVTVPFIDYIKNVASSEVYPTWSTAAIRANVIAQMSYALNRVYLEYYRSRGYDFDITNSTAIDQSFVYGRNTFASIDEVVDDVFGTYIRRDGYIEPLAAKYCDGVESSCSGLSQWGSEYLGQQGLNSFEILQQYYGDNIELVVDTPIRPVAESYPGFPLQLGSAGPYVRYIQNSLNRISDNYPGIPKLNVDGFFGPETENAVRIFQQTFSLTADGIAGTATLQKIASLVNGSSSGSSSSTLKYGSEGEMVKKLQQKLIDLKLYSGDVTGHYGYKTVAAVKSYQEKNSLTADGIAGKETLTSLGLTDSSSGSSSGGSSVTLTSNYGITVKDKVIVRSYYTTSSNEKTRLAKNTYFKILSTHVSGSYTWLRIQIGSTTGYLR